ncbi:MULTISPECIES: autotransporter outer membrane beta-barrel domain-containing protein [unclassified Bartonella]|uniref:autotransporter outer membrane beta-barrel domain-containing protein n=1 Tax=unclassified Bartonella TaxID=2645622 RepID=UPI0009996C8A|nr:MULTISPECIES: autotransporter outer membrane beta-barrel domain-containing protein [unclassified Bartonella]AQX22650.1 outer membrane autotransporter barrel domain-containing protein [Bartonella sp. 11B]AQX24066.1 outer membrane autotransporter barrel domain-containing protein [Bartonella sp. 114]
MSIIFSDLLFKLVVVLGVFLGNSSSVVGSLAVVNKCQQTSSGGDSSSNNNMTITLDKNTYIVKVCKEAQSKVNGQVTDDQVYQITDKTYQMGSNSEQSEEKSSSVESKGEIGIYTTSNVNVSGVNILGPKVSNDSNENDYIGILIGEWGLVVADRLVLKDLKTGISVSKTWGFFVGDGLVLKDLKAGISVSKNSWVNVDNTLISNNQIAVEANGLNAMAEVFNTEITVLEKGKGLFTKKGGWIQMEGIDKSDASINFIEGYAVYMDTGEVSLEKVNVISEGIQNINTSRNRFVSSADMVAVYMYPQSTFKMKEGKIDLKGGSGFLFDFSVRSSQETQAVEGPAFINSDIEKINVELENVDIKIDGDKHYGMYGVLSVSNSQDGDPERFATISLKKTNFIVPNSTAIYNDVKAELIFNLSDTKLSGGLLLEGTSGIINIKANNSQLEGGALISGSAEAHLKLENNSTWTLTKRKSRGDRGNEGTDNNKSFISTVTLKNSKIIFEKPSDNVYQTLSIGTGNSLVYTAEGNAELYLNSYLDQSNSDTDRLLIDGDVSGVTVVSVSTTVGDLGDKTGSGNTQGVSLIQVSGTAQEDSFKLKDDYITADNLPYQYVLSAYGPSSQLGQADPGQKLVGQNGKEGEHSSSNFWDYRLQSKYITPSEPEPVQPAPSPEPPVPSEPEDPIKPDLPVKRVPAVVPQLPSYLLLPHALFHTGLVDVSNQHELLEIMQSAFHEAAKKRKTNFFIRGYGSNHSYTSNLSVFEYGYGADLDYNNATAGIVFNTLESKDSASSFGVMGGYGQLSLHPRAVKHSQKSVFDKWSGKLYVNLDHDTGFYANGFLSYDFFKGDVVTLSRGKTAELKGRLLNAALSGGQAIITGYHGFILEPQLQVIYQSLLFDEARDIDRFDIDLGKHDQLIGRIGGRLIKAFASSEKGHVVSFYSNLHVAHSYEKKRIVHFKDAFQLGAFGSTVETGAGVHAQLSNAIALHGDLLYQHKLTKAGFSGISVSGSLRYQF